MKIVNLNLRKALYEKGYESLREYCRKKKIDYKTARLIIGGLLTGERSEKVKEIKKVLIEDFGEEVLCGKK